MIISASFTRPANTTAYASGDVINGDTVVVPLSFTIPALMINPKVSGLSIVSSNQTSTFTAVLHLFSASFATEADNVAFAPTDANIKAYYIGGIAVGAAWNAFTANKVSNTLLTLPIPVATENMLATGTFYGVLVITGAYTPVSAEEFKINLHVD